MTKKKVIKKSKAELEPEAIKSDVVQAKIPIWKYFQLKDPPIHEYTRAYLSGEFHGILKIEEDWKKILEENNYGDQRQTQ